MVRSSRVLVLVLLSAMVVVACGEEPQEGLDLTAPTAVESVVPFALGVIQGSCPRHEVLTLRVTREDEIYAFASEDGLTLAFRIDPALGHRPVALPGVSVLPTPAACRAEVRRRLAVAGLASEIREGRDAEAFLVDIADPGKGDAIADLLASLRDGRDLCFLIEVLPRERYPERPDEALPPRLEAEPYPWPESEEAFDRYKAAEVARWREAKAASIPYAPSREGLLVLPRHGTSAESVSDFGVFEWPAEPAHRFDGRAFREPETSRDPYTGRPAVLFRVAEVRQTAFEAWTRENVGLPLAVVLDWEARSTPVINAPLRDDVQITLGSGSWAELQAEAEALLRTLRGGGGALPMALVATLARRADSTFEALVPLSGGGDVTVDLETAGGATLRRTFRHQSQADASLPYAIEAVLGEMFLGRLSAEAAAVRLRGLAPESVEGLAAVVASDPSTARRVRAVAVLGLVDRASDTAKAALAAALADPAPSIRRAAALAHLHLAPSPGIVPALLEAMRASAARDDLLFVEVLGKMGPEAEGAFEALLDLAAHGERSVSGAARMALSYGAWSEDARLRAAGDDPDPAVRAAAVTTVGATGEVSRLPWILARAKDPDARVRAAATDALIVYAWPPLGEHLLPHVDALFVLLEDPEEAVRANVANVLGELGGEALPRLLALVEHARPEVRQAALVGLGASEALRADALSVLRDALGDADRKTRLTAVRPYLRHAGKPVDVVAVLEEGLADGAVEIRRAALALFLETGLQPSDFPARLVALLDDADEATRGLAALVLVRDGVASEKAGQIVEAVERDPDHPLHGFVRSER